MMMAYERWGKIVKILLTCIYILPIHSKIYAQDSLKVHVIGYFFNKGESYKFYFDKKLCEFKVSYSGLNAYAFYMPVPDTIKSGEKLDLYIYKKARFGVKYKNVRLEPGYYNDRKYFILLRSNRLKNKYALIEYWYDEDPLGIIKDEFWETGKIPDWAKCNCHENK